ncbi:ATP-dependent helicase HrpB [Prosthecobacter sp.]|uniref:ATP-dependent helicase HrpB n=1 Tax=Prosthecobacter sp. TaxID=1965333 RepID=UPI002ABC115D|nr:ATP-dependent helicase HrpB [Prosthecobacter sp.]MDZ4405438.1 ATP-dependent helicase HrpB [Prosthecobacter sp.]
MPASTALPIWKIHAEILRTLQDGNRLVLVAPTGSGKTTQVPQMLLDAGIAGEKMIVVLQPRRVAARTVATRVAWEREGKLGAEVGYQIRFDDHTSVGTRICFVTEGILLRWLQDDRSLSKIGAVVFDEFHERNLLSDVALALVKHLQQTQRPDLAMVVMSATLDAEPVAAYLDQCPILVSEGQSYPVEVGYLSMPDPRPITVQAAEAVERILQDEDPGDILIFMPGRGEIHGTLDALRGLRTRERVACIPLHGELEPQEQDRAFAPNSLRKVIVATNVAETSITIDGIRHVVDSGVARVARYDAERGIGTLLLEPISCASADQRKGRAGRTAPGTCHRLWTVIGHKDREERNTPEIQRSDLAEVVLLLHSLGIREAAAFDWLDKPDPQAVVRAERLLTMLGALLDADLTPIGRQMLRLPMHPRYSRMLIEASQRGCVPDAALCAALVSGRDLLARLDRDDAQTKAAREMFEESADSDFITLMRAYDFAKANGFSFDRCRSYGINAQVARQVEQTFQQIMHAVKQSLPGHDAKATSSDALLRCLMAGFVDQLAKRRAPGKPECDLTDQRQGQLVRESVVTDATYIVAANLRETPSRQTLLSLATAVQPAWIAEMFPQHLSTTVEHLFDAQNKRVAAMKLVRYRDLVIEQKAQQRDLDPIASGRCLAEAHRAGAFDLPLMDHRLKQFIARVNLVHATLPELEFAPFDEAAITTCLARAFTSLSLAKEAQAAPLIPAFHQHLDKGQVSWLDELAPLTTPWPSGGTIKLSYVNDAPEAQVKLQECFALTAHPTLCEGRLPVQLQLCTPDGKRLAITSDWPGFVAREWPKHRQAVAKKFPGVLWR